MSTSSSLQGAHVRGVLATRRLRYPVVLPTVRDPRLHLAAVIVSLQVLGQVAFDFRLSIAQILIAIGTCAILEVAIVVRRQQVLMWPASALLTGNGVAFILRVPGTEHGDWWSTNGWWIFAGTAAVSLLSKYLIRFRGAHVFNPSNLGLVLCFLLLGPELADPLDFWWGPMSPALALALAIIVVGSSGDPLPPSLACDGARVLARVRCGGRGGRRDGSRDHRSLAPGAGRRHPPVDDPGVLARDPRLPLLHAHGSADGSEGTAGTDRVRRRRRPSRRALRRPRPDRVLGEGRSPGRTHARVCRAAAGGARAVVSTRPSQRRHPGVRGSRCIRGDVDRDRRRHAARSSGCRSRPCRSRRLPSSSFSPRKASTRTLDRALARRIAVDIQRGRPASICAA